MLVADLLCGAGGSSTGCARALAELGLEMELVCVNHWDVAIETHRRNHPGGIAGMVVLSGYPSALYDESLPDWRRIEITAMARWRPAAHRSAVAQSGLCRRAR